LNNTSGSNVSASPVTTTTYGVTGTDVNGCSRTDSLTFNPLRYDHLLCQ
jgi:hypothetical protein